MSAIKHKRFGLSMWCYCMLVHLYPRDFRREFEFQMSQTFGDLMGRAFQSRGVVGLLDLWRRTLPDLLSSAIGQRFRTNSDKRFRFRWIVACGIGVPLGGAFALAVLFFPSRPLIAARSLLGFALPSGPSFPVVAASLVAIPLGWMQSRVFGWRLRERLTWTALTVLGVGGAWGGLYVVSHYTRFYNGSFRLLVNIGGLVLAGSVIGLLQAVAFSNKTQRAWMWIPSCVVAMIIVGLLTGYLERSSYPLLAPLVGGAVFGLFTAIPLEWILKESSLTEQVRSADFGVTP